MRYLVIGLGIYGSNLAKDLASMGHEVIGVDIKKSAVEALKNDISTVYCVDTTDAASLGVLPFKNVDLVIVAIGENFGASVKTVALLKNSGVRHIYARAADALHHSILKWFDIDRILVPEQRAANDLAMEMILGTDVMTMRVASETFVAKFRLPQYYVGKTYGDIAKSLEGMIRLVTVARSQERKSVIGINQPELETICGDYTDVAAEAGDVITCLGNRKALLKMMRQIS